MCVFTEDFYQCGCISDAPYIAEGAFCEAAHRSKTLCPIPPPGHALTAQGLLRRFCCSEHCCRKDVLTTLERPEIREPGKRYDYLYAEDVLANPYGLVSPEFNARRAHENCRWRRQVHVDDFELTRTLDTIDAEEKCRDERRQNNHSPVLELCPIAARQQVEGTYQGGHNIAICRQEGHLQSPGPAKPPTYASSGMFIFGQHPPVRAPPPVLGRGGNANVSVPPMRWVTGSHRGRGSRSSRSGPRGRGN